MIAFSSLRHGVRSLTWSTQILFLLLLTTTLPNPTTASNLGAVDIDELLDPATGALKPQAYIPASPKSPNQEDQKEKADHSPWTHPPTCTHSTSLSSLGTKFCTYTNNATFLNGFSIITTPKVALQAAEFLEEHPVLHFIGPDKGEDWIREPRPFKLAEIPNKGMGVVATRKIKQYETYMMDQASVIMDLRIEKSVSEAESLRLLKVGVDQLRSPRLVRELSAKHKGHDHDGVGGEGDLEEHIMMTNSFGTELNGESFRGVFPLISRINHACNPNSFVMFSQSGFSIAIKAYQDILPGEEITISYLYLGAPSHRRKENLERWGFKCTCDLCSLPPTELAASDKRRMRIEEGELEFQQAWKDKRYEAAKRIGEELVELIKEEGLTPMLTDEYVMLARIHYLQEEREIAEEYKDMAVELLGELGFLGDARDEEWSLERIFEAFGNRGLY